MPSNTRGVTRAVVDPLTECLKRRALSNRAAEIEGIAERVAERLRGAIAAEVMEGVAVPLPIDGRRPPGMPFQDGADPADEWP